MRNITINADKSAKYLGDVVEFIPSNVLLTKGVTGCGATTLEITCNRHSIIAVPYISLITNKCEQHTELLGVYGGVSISDIQSYVSDTLVSGNKLKIMVTYDSVSKVIRALDNIGFNTTDEAFLLIDEYHCLRTQYSFRSEAIIDLLNTVKTFNKTSFVTATPISREFTLEALSSFPIMEVKWHNTEEIVYSKAVTNSPKTLVKNMVEGILNGDVLGNYYFFVNSVTFMYSILKACKEQGIEVNNSNIGLFCSKNEENTMRVEKLGFEVSETIGSGKRINFLTSKCFEGVDIYDELGRTVIVSDGAMSNTLIEVGTAIKQIAGRIRNAKDKSITHILSYKSSSRYDLPKEEFENKVNNDVIVDKEVFEIITSETASDEAKKRLKGSLSKTIYLNETKDGVIFFDPELVIQDKYNYDILNTYKTHIRVDDAYKAAGFIQKTTIKRFYDVTDELVKTASGYSFQELVELVHEMNIINEDVANYEERKKAIEQKSEYVFLALEYLGFEEILSMGFKVAEVKKKLNRMGVFAENNALENRVRRVFRKGLQIENKVAKEVLKDIYSELGIKGSAQVKHLSQWFEIEQKRAKEMGVTKRYIVIK